MTGRRSTTTIVVAVLVGVAVMAGASVLALHTGDEARGKHWPSSIVPLARFVEREHGTKIDPVPVRFLADAAFERSIAGDSSAPTTADAGAAADTGSELRALGLVGHDFDLTASQRDLNTGGTAAYYDSATKTIVVRGTTMTEDVKATLVHELTHVAQDASGSLDTDQHDDPRSLMALSIVEGDATRIQQRWVSQLSPRASDRLQKEADQASSHADAALSDVPPVLTTTFEAPYSLGQAFTRVVAAVQGNKGVERLTTKTPADDLGLLDPIAWLDGRKGTTVARPRPDAGRVLDRSRMGAVTLFAVLAQRLEPSQALDAADGWGGDAYVSWRNAGRTCSRTRFRGSTSSDTAVLGDALRAWVDRGPREADATVTATGGGSTVTLSSCEPRGAAATKAPVTAATAGDALLLPTIRGSVEAELLEARLPRTVARCAGDAVIKVVPFASLRDDPDAIAKVAPGILAKCRSGQTTGAPAQS